MAVHFIESGYGVALIDPHGDLAEGILELVPAQRLKDAIYFKVDRAGIEPATPGFSVRTIRIFRGKPSFSPWKTGAYAYGELPVRLR
jgi:hypothetical protein